MRPRMEAVAARELVEQLDAALLRHPEDRSHRGATAVITDAIQQAVVAAHESREELARVICAEVSDDVKLT